MRARVVELVGTRRWPHAAKRCGDTRSPSRVRSAEPSASRGPGLEELLSFHPRQNAARPSGCVTPPPAASTMPARRFSWAVIIIARSPRLRCF